MIIVADSGSTKTAWAICERERVSQFECEGLNPHFTSDHRYLDLADWLRSKMRELEREDGESTLAVYFYGAGCGTVEKQEHVRDLLHRALPEAGEVEVAGDLLGACRALYGKESGVAGILGTGSNACLYDGEKIVGQVFSTGYLLGDEGSGNHIGRKLLKSYLTKAMPETLRKTFYETYGMSDAAFLDQVYRKPNANRFLASLAPFALRHREETYISEMLERIFEEYITEQVAPVMQERGSRRELRIVGGIAAHFGNEIQEAARRHEIELTKTLERPLEQLVEFHKNVF